MNKKFLALLSAGALTATLLALRQRRQHRSEHRGAFR